MTSFFKRSYTPFLVDPDTRGALIEVVDGVAPADNPDQVYPVDDGILRMASSKTVEASYAYDQQSAAQGRIPPDEHTFRGLPRDGLPGWESRYWDQRAVSTAGLWHFLEERRRERGQLPFDVMGVAADLTGGLPYIAYGLDVGSYVTVALSPYAGAFGLGAYPYTRYYRVQIDWERLPLKPNTYHLVIFSDAMASISSDALPAALDRAVDALTRDGDLIITDAADQDHLSDMLHERGLSVQQRPITADDDPGFLQKMRTMFKGKAEAPPLIIGRKR